MANETKEMGEDLTNNIQSKVYLHTTTLSMLCVPFRMIAKIFRIGMFSSLKPFRCYLVQNWYHISCIEMIVLLYRTPDFSGEFSRIDPDVKFYENEDVDGVHLMTDFDMARQLQIKIGKYAKGPLDFFPVMWPVNLSNENINFLETAPYVMVPKPVGPRFLLYVDSSGSIYLENMTQHIFRVDEDHAIKMHSVTDTILDGIITREKSSKNCDAESAGRPTFFIQDAIRCNGRDLTGLNILERIAVIKVT